MTQNNQTVSNSRGGARVGAGRRKGALTRKTREIAIKAAYTGMTPLEVMIDNMRHFQKSAIDAEAEIAGMTTADIAKLLRPDASPDDQMKYLLAKVKSTAGLRQMAQDAARDAAPFIHPKLANVVHTGRNGGPIATDNAHHGTIAVSDTVAFITEAIGD